MLKITRIIKHKAIYLIKFLLHIYCALLL